MSNEETKQPEQKPKPKRTLLQRIVNVFLYIGLVILVLFVILFGISQTQTFRNWLRDFVVEIANDNLNGKVSIEKIEGTIFTSLVLKNTIVTMDKDTLLDAGLIELRTSPLKIFLKKIYVRKAEIKDTRIAFVADSAGELNISKLFPPTEEEEDTAKGSFPFRIEVADFKLTNVNFSLQTYDKVGSREYYSSLNMDDFRVEDIYLSLKAFADIDNNTFEAKIENLSLNPNIKGFNLKSFSGEFRLSPKEIIVNDLLIATENSDLHLNAKVNGLNVFDSTMTDNLKYADMNISLESRGFNFDDLSSFIPPIDILKGAVGVQLKASGNLVQLDVSKLVLDYVDTHLETKAVIRNIDNLDDMTITANFTNSYLSQSDISKMLPEYGIPSFEKLGGIKIDTLVFSGAPLKFKSSLQLSTKEGKIFAKVDMNLEKPIAEYDIQFNTVNFNLTPIAGISSSLNLKGSFAGRGFSPKEMNSNILLVGDGSTIEGIKFDSLSLTSEAKEGIMSFSLFSLANQAKVGIDGKLDFLQTNLGYTANGIVENLDAGQFISDTSLTTDLNFTFKTEGENFDVDKMNMYLTLDLSKSTLNGVVIDSLRTITDIFTDNNDERVINFISDIADITFKGNFSLIEAVDVISREVGVMSKAYIRKISEILPSKKLDNYLAEMPISKSIQNIKSKLLREKTTIQYLVDLKNFGIISPFLNEKRLEIDGGLSGNFIFDNDSISVTLNSDFNYLKFWGKDDVFFISKLSLGLESSNAFNSKTTEGIDAALNLKINRIFAGTDIRNFIFDFNLKNNFARVNFASKVEDYASVKLDLLADIRTSVVSVDIQNLDLIYRGFDLRNKEKLNILFSEKRIDFTKFRLVHADGEISANGFLAENENQNLELKIQNIAGKDLISSFSKSNALSDLDFNLSLDALIEGNFAEPEISMNLLGKNLSYKEKRFGELVSSFNYKHKNFVSDIKYFDSNSGTAAPSLKIIGNIPINLSFTDTGKRILAEEEIEVELTANNFDLTPYGEIIPGVSKFKGMLNSDLKIIGTIQEPYPTGYLALENSSFLLEYNNLEYNAAIRLSLAKDYFSLDNFLLANSSGTKSGGTITGSGTAELENFNMVSSQFSFNGSLKVLSDESKYVSPNLYGDLVISTNGNFELKFDRNGAQLKAPINIDVAKLTYSQAQSSYSSSAENFIYKFVEDTISKSSKKMDFDALVNLSKQQEAEEIQKASKQSKFDYSIDVRVEDEAILTFILSREFNQNLTAILRGNFQYESIGGKPVAQGELELLEGSTLEFLKTFTAQGKIRFESELSNPYLDITATYKNYYYPLESSTNGESSQSGSEEIEVAVKMNIKGELKELDKNLSQQSEKLTVYYGAKNIEDNIPDPTKDASDAVMFMLLGKFNDNVTQQERNIVSSYATSFAGSLVGGFLNRQLGDYVRSLEIRQSGTDTKFILAGRAGKFRYSIGGSTAVFQDLGQANVKIEYPITRNFFMRLERRESLTESKYINEMVNEVGLKYRFEF